MEGSLYVSSGSSSNNGSSTHTSSKQESTSGSLASGGRGSWSDRWDQGGRKPVVCFGCGESGHIRPNFPEWVRRVKSRGSSSVMVVDGRLAGLEAKNLRIDTGDDRRTVVRKDYIPEVAYTGDHIDLYPWKGSQPSIHKLAQITIKVGAAEALCVVAVADSMDCPALLGTDLGGPLTRALMEHVIAKTTQRAETPIEASPSSAQPSVSVGDGQN